MERAEETFRPRGILKSAVARRRAALAAAALVFVALASLLAYAARGRGARGAYALAEDCPRGALVYAQAADLPALLRLWDDSKLKERYLASTNFRKFTNGHVALKLLERAQEFEGALGFALDGAALAEASETEAAVAVYDIGRMELVFVARVGEEKALAARFFQAADGFEKTELPDGTVYYARDVEADRGRQKQKVLFAFARGRFVLATGEQLLLRTLANLGGRSRADRLSDDPAFRTLSREVTPHLAAVWVDQTRLNGDYYFKHYWAMSDAASLKGIRAGLFDFEMREGGWLERREFLTAGNQRRAAALSPQDVRELSGAIPDDAAYVRLRVLADGAAGAAALVSDALLERAPGEDAGGRTGGRLHDEFDPTTESGGYTWDRSYEYLDSDYDEAVDDPSEDEGGEGEGTDEDEAAAALERVLERARPSRAAAAEGPHTQEGPLFVEFRRLAVLRLDNPGGLDTRALEAAVNSLIAGRLTVAGASAALKWSDAGEGALRRRELELPMLGWRLCYALRGRELFVSNDSAFLEAALGGGARRGRRAEAAFAPDDVTVIRLDRRGEAFDEVFGKLDAGRVEDYRASRGGEAAGAGESPSEEFFSGNVASLLDVASNVTRVEVRRRSTPGRLREEVELITSAAGPGEPSR